MRVSKTFIINQVPQWLYIHLAEQPRASLLFLHGGPGWSDAPWAHLSCEHLWNDFNIIHWDQRGANRSFLPSLDATTVSLEQLISDGIEVVRTLQTVFGIERPILVGHSWGAMLGVLLSMRAPELFHSYVGVGQLVSNSRSESISLDFCKRMAKSQAKMDLLTELESLDNSFYINLNKLFRQRELLFDLGGEFVSEVSQEKLTSWMASGPTEYQSSWEKMYQTCTFSMEHLWKEVVSKDLMTECQSLKIPVTILQGRNDFCTASSIAFQWFQRLQSKRKQFIWFENSAHWPQFEENEKWSKFFLEYPILSYR